MDYKVGDIVEGKVASILNFGAFVKLENKSTGFIHISELSNKYIKNISDLLHEGQEIKAIIKKIDKISNKISLSMKQLELSSGAVSNSHLNPQVSKNSGNKYCQRTPYSTERPESTSSENTKFENMLSKFKKISDENICTLKRNERSKQRRSGNIR